MLVMLNSSSDAAEGHRKDHALQVKALSELFALFVASAKPSAETRLGVQEILGLVPSSNPPTPRVHTDAAIAAEEKRANEILPFFQYCANNPIALQVTHLPVWSNSPQEASGIVLKWSDRTKGQRNQPHIIIGVAIIYLKDVKSVRLAQ